MPLFGILEDWFGWSLSRKKQAFRIFRVTYDFVEKILCWRHPITSTTMWSFFPSGNFHVGHEMAHMAVDSKVSLFCSIECIIDRNQNYSGVDVIVVVCCQNTMIIIQPLFQGRTHRSFVHWFFFYNFLCFSFSQPVDNWWAFISVARSAGIVTIWGPG
jgi:hypothetical protein